MTWTFFVFIPGELREVVSRLYFFAGEHWSCFFGLVSKDHAAGTASGSLAEGFLSLFSARFGISKILTINQLIVGTFSKKKRWVRGPICLSWRYVDAILIYFQHIVWSHCIYSSKNATTFVKRSSARPCTYQNKKMQLFFTSIPITAGLCSDSCMHDDGRGTFTIPQELSPMMRLVERTKMDSGHEFMRGHCGMSAFVWFNEKLPEGLTAIYFSSVRSMMVSICSLEAAWNATWEVRIFGGWFWPILKFCGMMWNVFVLFLRPKMLVLYLYIYNVYISMWYSIIQYTM